MPVLPVQWSTAADRNPAKSHKQHQDSVSLASERALNTAMPRWPPAAHPTGQQAAEHVEETVVEALSTAASGVPAVARPRYSAAGLSQADVVVGAPPAALDATLDAVSCRRETGLVLYNPNDRWGMTP